MRYENIQLIKLICWWHDVGRLFGPIHEELGGQIARYNLPGHGCNEETAEIVYRAIRSHKWTMEPETIEGNIL
jgi:UTP:GlnB (protein PII) uridylyltransferase